MINPGTKGCTYSQLWKAIHCVSSGIKFYAEATLRTDISGYAYSWILKNVDNPDRALTVGTTGTIFDSVTTVTLLTAG